MYKQTDLVYLNTGDYEYVVQIKEIKENGLYQILNGIFRAVETLPEDPDMSLDTPTVFTIPEPWKPEDEPVFPMFSPKFRVPEWIPIHMIYPHIDKKETFDIEKLSEIVRYANSYEFDNYIRVLGSYDSSWREGLNLSPSIPAAENKTIHTPMIIPGMNKVNKNSNIISISIDISSTQDCKSVLNSNLGDKNWKRVFKFGTDDTESLRCFSGDDGTVCYVGHNGDSFYLHVNPPLSKQELESIRIVARWYHTHDYGNMYYNPWDKKLLICGGDGGYIFSKTKVDEEALERFDFDSFVEFNTHPETDFIDDVIWADEYTPDQLDEDDDNPEGFFWVGRISIVNE